MLSPGVGCSHHIHGDKKPENALRKSTAWTLADIWIQTEHDQADTSAPGVFQDPQAQEIL